MKWHAISLAALTAMALPVQAQVYKCKGSDGRTVMQQMPCADGRGGKVDVRPASGHAPQTAAAAPAPVAPPASAPEPTPPVPTPPPPAQAQPSAAPASPLDQEAQACLAWYRPLLKNPRDAYYTNASKDKRVLTLTIHATNTYGGVVTKQASCEIHGGQLNEKWTKIHAERLGW